MNGDRCGQGQSINRPLLGMREICFLATAIGFPSVSDNEFMSFGLFDNLKVYPAGGSC